MNKNPSKILFLSLMILIFSSSFVMAQKYTPKPRKSKTSYTNQHENSKKCLMADLDLIEKFDAKARSKVKRYLKFREKNKGSAEQTDEFFKKLEKYRTYFNSDKYKTMKEIYKKCDREIPWPWTDAPFWNPNAKRNSAI